MGVNNIEKILTSIEAELAKQLKQATHDQTLLHKASSYLLLAPSKKIRPLLTILSCQVAGGDVDVATTAGCAIEMMHTYSLIHDDLPAMDDGKLRRGLPCLHLAYDEATAILVGDFLLNSSFELLSTHLNCSDKQKIDLIAILAKAGGARGLVGGQLMDLNSRRQVVDIELMHRYKTAALFEAATMFGAVIANELPKTIQYFGDIGLDIGLLFQLVDDILDGDHPGGEKRAMLLAEKKLEEIHCKLTNLAFDSTPFVTILELITNRLKLHREIVH